MTFLVFKFDKVKVKHFKLIVKSFLLMKCEQSCSK